MAGFGVLILATVAWVPQLVLFRGRAAAEAPGSGAIAARDGNACSALGARPPAITISIEPDTHGPCSASESPVVLPGILLPPEASEEPAHAGS
jgi:hypothetical protein